MKKFFAFLLIPLLFSSCSLPETLFLSGKKQVIVSFYPLEFLTQQIAGNFVDVKNIMPIGVEPHDYEATARDLVAIQKSSLLLFLGGSLDVWVQKIISSLPETVLTQELSKGLKLLPTAFHDEKNNDQFDPHVWLDPLQYIAMANTIKEGLQSIDSAHHDAYEKNTKELTAKLEMLHESFQSGLKNCKKHDIIVSHDAFTYLAKRYNFHTIAIAGISPNNEPSPKHLAELSDLMKKNNIHYVFFERLLSPILADTLAEETGAKVLLLDPIESLTKETETENYISLMQKNLENLKTAMECQ